MSIISPSEVLVVIPARGGSKGIPKKNIKSVGGIPLIAWSIRASLDENKGYRTVVSTDDSEIAEISESFGAEVLKRPPGIAGDDSPTELTLIHAFESLKNVTPITHIVLLQPTSPIRRPNIIASALDQLEKEKADSLVGVLELSPFLWRVVDEVNTPSYKVASRKMRQNFLESEVVFLETGNIYITTSIGLIKSACRVSGNISLFKMTRFESLEIDTHEELELIDVILSK